MLSISREGPAGESDGTSRGPIFLSGLRQLRHLRPEPRGYTRATSWSPLSGHCPDVDLRRSLRCACSRGRQHIPSLDHPLSTPMQLNRSCKMAEGWHSWSHNCRSLHGRVQHSGHLPTCLGTPMKAREVSSNLS